MEIVTEPDFRTAEEAKGFVRELQLLLQTIGSCDGNMQGTESAMWYGETQKGFPFCV